MLEKDRLKNWSKGGLFVICMLKLIVIKIKKNWKIDIFFFIKLDEKIKCIVIVKRFFFKIFYEKIIFNSIYCVYYLKYIFDYDFDFFYCLKIKNLWGICIYEIFFVINVFLLLLKWFVFFCILDVFNYVCVYILIM